MTENCVICKKPITKDDKFIKLAVYLGEPSYNIRNAWQYCHIARKCTDKLPLTASERAEMDRVIAMELDRG